jgi:hypothetical protein
VRARLRRQAIAASEGDDGALDPEAASAVLGWVETALMAHAGLARPA